MGNAIRQLKLEISGSDIDMPEQDVRIVLRSSFFTVKETGVYNRRRISYVKK
jgi:hypothetical protein